MSKKKQLVLETRKRNFFISALRRVSFRWSERAKADKDSRIKIGEFSTGKPKFGYICAACGGIFKKLETELDHILPVVPTEGWTNEEEFDANEYVDRMLCNSDEFARLCKTCHLKKSGNENALRKERKSAKLSKKENE